MGTKLIGVLVLPIDKNGIFPLSSGTTGGFHKKTVNGYSDDVWNQYQEPGKPAQRIDPGPGVRTSQMLRRFSTDAKSNFALTSRDTVRLRYKKK